MDGTKVNSFRPSFTQWFTKSFVCCFVLGAIVCFSGCAGLTAQLGYLLYGNKAKAEYNSLQEKKVAVVVLSNSSEYGPDNSAHIISTAVRLRLAREIKDIKLVPINEIESWIDSNFEVIDYAEIGKALKADRVVAIDLESYSLYDGQTLYKGRATYTVSVFDMEKDGEVTFRRGPNEFEFPSTHGQPVTNMSETQFERYFVNEIADSISRYFYAYELHDDIARNPAHMGP